MYVGAYRTYDNDRTMSKIRFLSTHSVTAASSYLHVSPYLIL